MKPERKRLVVAAAIVVVTIAAGYGRRHYHGAVGTGFALIAVILFGRKLLGGVKGASSRIRAARAAGIHGYPVLAEAIPAWMRGVASTEGQIYREVAYRLAKRVPPSDAIERSAPPGQRYSLANGPVSSLLMPLAIVGLLSDLPLSLVLVAIFQPTHAAVVHLALFAAALWGVAWIAGDRSAVKAITHVVGSREIRLRVGFRWSVAIPITAVRVQHRLQGSTHESLPKLSVQRDDVLMVTPIDSPNVLIDLDLAQLETLSVEKFGAAVPCRRFIAIYVDDPASFMRNLADAKQALGANQLETINE